MLKCWVDGGAKPNPGSLYGSFKIFKDGKETAHRRLLFVDKGTNNQAEYKALISLLDYLIELATNEFVLIHMDSRLVVKQVTNEYRVRAKPLMVLKNIVDTKLAQLNNIKFKHVPRIEVQAILGH